MMRGATTLLVLLGAWLAASDPVWANEPTQEVRILMELAILEGRAHDVATIRRASKADGPIGLWPQAVVDLWWRPDPSIRTTYEKLVGESMGERTGLMGARYRWLLSAPPRAAYPLPEDGVEDPYPVITALIQERIRRDEIGLEGLPDSSPLYQHRNHPNERMAWFAKESGNHMARTYYGVPPKMDEIRMQEKADELALRNLLLAMATLLLLLLVPVWIGRRVKGPQ